MPDTAVAAPPPPPADAPDELVVQRVALRGVPWSFYDQLLTVIGDGPQRVTYDRGRLEIETPSKRHETLKWIAGRFIEAFADEADIDYEAAGSTTWRRAAVEGGLEADESYYIQNVNVVAGRDVDLTVDPPPDLAVEIDLSPPEVEKASVYARLGVPEIWRWRNRQLVVLIRRADGTYAEGAQSAALPGFPLAALATALAQYPHVTSKQAVAEFRRYLTSARPQA